jgi:transposase
MACLGREFGISRKTGYKILDRYQECGLEASAAVLSSQRQELQ